MLRRALRTGGVWTVLFSFSVHSTGAASLGMIASSPTAARILMPAQAPLPRQTLPKTPQPAAVTPAPAWSYFGEALDSEARDAASKLPGIAHRAAAGARRLFDAAQARLTALSNFEEETVEAIKPIDLDLPAKLVRRPATRPAAPPPAVPLIRVEPAKKAVQVSPLPVYHKGTPPAAPRRELASPKPDWALVRPEHVVRKPLRLVRRLDAYQVVDRSEVNGIQVLRHKAFVPATTAFAAAGARNRSRRGTVQKVGFEPSRPFGERTIYEETFADGTRRQFRSSPLVFDLGGGIEMSGRGALFDLKGAGQRGKMQWINDIGPRTGLLVLDSNRNGTAGENGLELFGSSTDLDGDGAADGFSDGFAALRALAEKAAGAGVISRRALERGLLEGRELAALDAAYGLKMKVGGLNRPPVSLSEAGVMEIALSSESVKLIRNFDGQGNDVSRQDGAVFLRRDGSTGAYEDVWFGSKNGVLVTKP